MFADLLKHQSLSQICRKFSGSISIKYDKNVTVAEYIIERFLDKKIDIGFSYKSGSYSPFFNTANKFNKFNVVFNDHEESSGYCAISYAKHTNNIGLILSTSTHGFTNICKPLNAADYHQIPLLLMSFYDKESELKLTKSMRPEIRYMKESHTINDSEKLPNLLEYIMMMAELPKKGPVHLNICNDILTKKVNLNEINIEKEKEDIYEKMIPEKEEPSLLQYYEKQYQLIEQSEQK
jgi:acetolactate synthase I/II/III large subunit